MITHKTIDGLLLRDMVVAGSALLEQNREAVEAYAYPQLAQTLLKWMDE